MSKEPNEERPTQDLEPQVAPNEVDLDWIQEGLEKGEFETDASPNPELNEVMTLDFIAYGPVVPEAESEDE